MPELVTPDRSSPVALCEITRENLRDFLRHQLDDIIVQHQPRPALPRPPGHHLKPRQRHRPRQKRATHIIAMQFTANLHIRLLQHIRRPFLPAHQGQDKGIKRTLRRSDLLHEFGG